MPSSTRVFRCLLVDDDVANQHLLMHYISQTPSLSLVKTLGDGVAALAYLREAPKVDIIFLDIEMPGLTGMELMRLLPHRPATILTTSHLDFALDAFELQVVDYLVKPIAFSRFTQAVLRVTEEISPSAPPPLESVFIKTNGRMVKIWLDRVRYIQALSDYIVVVTDDKQYVVYSTMKAVEEKLPVEQFIRVHRSYIVNTRKIEAIEDNTLLLAEQKIPVSKSYQESFFARISRI